MITLPVATAATTEYEDFYESTLSQPLAATDTDVYISTLPASAIGFLVIDPYGANPEVIYFNTKGVGYVRVPSNVDGEGRGVGTTSPRAFDSGTKVGMYSMAEYFEGFAKGTLLRDGFLQSRHFGSGIDPNAWIGTGEAWNYVGNNSQREYQYVTAGDKRTKYSLGQKLRMPRLTAVGTQSGSYAAASSQSAKKATPNNINFTAAFTFSAWIYLNSYPSQQTIFRRLGGGNGFGFRVTNGQLNAFYGSGGAITEISSYQSIPLKTWTHVTAVVSNPSTKTGAFYIDGVLAPTYYNQQGATALTQPSVDLLFGVNEANAEYFDGYMAEVQMWSTALSPSTILQYMNRQLVGNESGLVGYWKMNGTFNDSTANGNNLTSSGAIATNASAPLNATEYGILTGIDFSAGNSTMTVFTGRACNAPAENLSNISYSGAEAPVGFPRSRNNWRVETIKTNNEDVPLGSVGAWTATSHQLTIPRGEWRRGHKSDLTQYSTVSGTRRFYAALGNNAAECSFVGKDTIYFEQASTPYMEDNQYADTDFVTTTQTIARLYGQIISATGTERFIVSSRTSSVIFAESAYV